MAEHNPEAGLNLLESWRTVLDKQVEALQQEKIQDLEGLMQQSARIQQELQKILSSKPQLLRDRKITDHIRILHHEQGLIIESLKGQTEDLAREIGTLQRNKSSLGGYRQKKVPSPRFMSKRT